MKNWLCAIMMALCQLFGVSLQAQATTFDLPLNGEFEISGEIGAPLWATFLVTTNTSESPAPSGSGWVANIILTQSNDLGGFSAPQILQLGRNLLSVVRFSCLRGVSRLYRNKCCRLGISP